MLYLTPISAEEAVTGGTSTTFKDDAVMNISAQHGGMAEIYYLMVIRQNINTADTINGGEQRFKGNSLINLNHENSLYNTTLKTEGNASVNINADNALNYTDHIVFQKRMTLQQAVYWMLTDTPNHW